MANSLAAVDAGATRVHGTGLGVGERCGNTPMEQLLINFRLLGYIDNDLSKLQEYCELVSEACRVPLPFNQPIVGEDAFRTATGVHAAAVIKAMKKGHDWLADRVYSAVPAGWVGRHQTIEIGPMSGASNVLYWLQMHNLEPDPALAERILTVAKQRKRRLSTKEVFEIIDNKELAPAVAMSSVEHKAKGRVVNLTVNGTDHEILTVPNKVLLETLREDLGLTGTKFGCELGECGVCTVLVDGVPKLSCSTLTALCDGQEITTVEGLKGREAEAIQKAFAEEGASQCGYCTPSMAVMLNYILCKEGDVDIRDELSGNICRCTGYVKILRAYEKSIEHAKR
jgi:aerobic-type carbon monoxide dehydrogenase small subunit (CoxS/CutS family)